jgi:DNA anti-recombination protein RmuC
MTDRVQRLREAAQARHTATLQRAEDTVRRLAKRPGATITFRLVAEAAGVSRSWLYQQPQLRAQINQLRDRPTGGNRAAVPTAEQATADSLRQQLRTYREEINRLRAENQTLREQLARRLGTERAAAITSRP